MKIVYLHAADEGYGSDRVLLHMATSRRRAGDLVVVLLPEDSPGTWLSDQLELAGIEVRKVPLAVARRKYFSPRHLPRYVAELVKARRLVRNLIIEVEADILHVNTSALIVGAILGRPAKVKRLWHVHEIVHRPIVAARLLSALPCTADRVLAVSNAVADHLRAMAPFARGKVRVVHNGVRSAPGEPRWPRDPNVLYVGRLSVWKGYEAFLEMASALSAEFGNARFFLVGDAVPGDEDRLKRLKRAVAERNLADQVLVLGFCPDPGPLFDSASVVVVPSLRPDPLPTVVLEAMGHGCAVVGSDIGGIPEMIVHEKTGFLVTPGSSLAVAARVRELLLDPRLAEQMGRVGAERVRVHFSPARFEAEIDATYAELMHDGWPQEHHRRLISGWQLRGAVLNNPGCAGQNQQNPDGPHKAKGVLFLHTGADLYGSGYVLLNLLRALDRTKFHPTVIFPYDGPLVREIEKVGVSYVIHDMPILRRQHFTPWGMIAFSARFVASFFYLRRLIVRQRIDLVHTNTASTWCGGAAALSTGKKHVWQVMELVERPWIVSFLMRKMVSWFSVTVFCISEAVRQHFLKGTRGQEGKYVTLYHGVDLDQYDPEKVSGRAIREKLGLDADTVLVTFAGRISSWKGQDVFADAAKELLRAGLGSLRVRFLILGGCYEGQEHFLAELEKRIESIPDHGKYVSQFGFQENLPEWFAASDVFVLPSKLPEPNATVTIGAMAMKLPVIGTNIGGTPETVVDGRTGFLIPPNDPMALAEKIKVLAGDPKLRQSMGEKGCQRVKEKFSLQNYCRTVMEAYET